MTDDELAAIEERASKATPGPWVDLMQTYFERCKADKREHGNRWYHGTQRSSCPLLLIVRNDYHGEPIDPLDIPRRIDKYDLSDVLSLFWSSLPKRTTTMTEGFMRPEDAAFIAASRADVPALIAEIRRLREVERIAQEVLSLIARCGCSACGPALADLAAARTQADDALTRMSVVE